MKQKFFYLLVLLFVAGAQLGADAQNNKGGKAKPVRMTPEQRIEKQVNQVTQALTLDDATSAKFSVIYKQYLKDLQTCQHSGRATLGEINKIHKSQLTDAQIEQQIEARFAQTRKILDLREKYYREFKKVLQPRQIMKMYSIERNNGSKIKKELEHRNNKKKAKAKVKANK